MNDEVRYCILCNELLTDYESLVYHSLCVACRNKMAQPFYKKAMQKIQELYDRWGFTNE